MHFGKAVLNKQAAHRLGLVIAMLQQQPALRMQVRGSLFNDLSDVAQAILAGRHMKDLIRTQVTAQRGAPRLSYRMDHPGWSRLQHTLLGKTILFTDQEGWSDEAIVRAYRGQHHIEEAFKRMKNPHFVSWRPLHHWTDQKIRVHAFYCVLALLLSALLRRTLAQHGLELSIVKILQTLAGIKEVALLYRAAPRTTKPVISYSQLTPLQERLFHALRLDRFQPHAP